MGKADYNDRLKDVARLLSHTIVNEDCLLWIGALRRGYATMTISRPSRKLVYVHRWLYEQIYGSLPKHIQLDHLCRNRACVEPQHLEPVTARENVLRTDAPPALNAQKTRCPRGHKYDKLDTPDRRRRCNRCCRERYHERKANG
jgi:HNH endonuclease